MRCHYEVLNIARDSDEAQIKQAYRKLALRWHPDKNIDQPDVAKEQFQQVQQAYEVLSDSHERAWYDNHREQILKGGHTNYEDDSLDVFPYFTSSCFKGYGDDKGGFYAVYSEVFSKIASEDIEYMDSPEDFNAVPKFGNSQSTYDTVHEFYSYWQSYSTKKSYAWLSPNNPNDTRDRRILKLIDKENKKVQLKAKRERNEEVRNLVQFVRKRDKRVIAQKKVEEEKAMNNKIKQESIRKERMRERNREIEEQKTKQSQFIASGDLENKLRELEQSLANEFGSTDEEDYSSDESENEAELEKCNVKSGHLSPSCSNQNKIEKLLKSKAKTVDQKITENLYCVACNKIFKNMSSFQNHEGSKKHKERVINLIEEMNDDEEQDEVIDEDEVLNKEEDEVTDEEDEVLNKEKDEVINDNDELKQNKGVCSLDADERKTNPILQVTENDKSSDSLLQDNDLSENVGLSENDEISTAKTDRNKKARSRVTVIDNEITSGDEILAEMNQHSSDDNWDTKRNKKEKKKKQKCKVDKKPIYKLKSEDLVESPPSIAVKTNKNANKQKISDLVTKTEGLDLAHDCVTCKQPFTSKNKLFAHLKKTGHGVALFKSAKERRQ